MKRFFLILSLLLLLFTVTVSSHPGRTDANGGHWDRSDGTYHFHTGEYAGRSSSGSTSNSESKPFTPPYEPPTENPYKEIKPESEESIIDADSSEEENSKEESTLLIIILSVVGVIILVIIIFIAKKYDIENVGCLFYVLIFIIATIFNLTSCSNSESEEPEEPETYESHIEICDGNCDHIKNALDDALEEHINVIETYDDHIAYCDGTCDHIENEIEHRISDLGEICYLENVYDYYDVYSREDLEKAYIQGYGDCHYGNKQEYDISNYKNENVFD